MVISLTAKRWLAHGGLLVLVVAVVLTPYQKAEAHTYELISEQLCTFFSCFSYYRLQPHSFAKFFGRARREKQGRSGPIVTPRVMSSMPDAEQRLGVGGNNTDEQTIA